MPMRNDGTLTAVHTATVCKARPSAPRSAAPSALCPAHQGGRKLLSDVSRYLNLRPSVLKPNRAQAVGQPSINGPTQSPQGNLQNSYHVGEGYTSSDLHTLPLKWGIATQV